MAVQPQIVPNITSNTITVRATTSVAAIIEKVIASNDKPRAEIVVDVEILEVNRERAKEFGLDLAQYGIGGIFSPDSRRSGSDTLENTRTSSLIRAGDFYLSVPSAVINFLETDSETRLIAKPQLRGQEGTTLTLNLGDDIPVPTTAFTPIAAGGASVNPLTSFNYRPIGVIVEMTPRVTYENEIILDLMVENSTLGPNINVAGQSLPTFGSRKVVTRLRLQDGESNLLAGLLRDEDRRSLRGFPGIMRVPVVRRLLSANEDSIKQTDIIMLLTPRIIRTHELTQEDVSPIHIGTQGNIGLSDAPSVFISAQETGNLSDVENTTQGTEDPVGQILSNREGIETSPPPFSQIIRSDSETKVAVSLTPPSSELLVGEGPYLIQVSARSDLGVSTMTLSLAYNPSVLQVSSVEEGSFMSQGGVTATFIEQVNETLGSVDLLLARDSEADGAFGAGVIAEVMFKAIASGETMLRVSGLGLTPDGSALTLDSQITRVIVR